MVCSLDLTRGHIVDISDPANPAKAAFTPSKPGTRSNEVEAAQVESLHFNEETLVASNEPWGSIFLPRLKANGAAAIAGQGGVSIWDVTNPTMARALKQNLLDFGVHNTFIWQQGESAYMVVINDDSGQRADSSRFACITLLLRVIISIRAVFISRPGRQGSRRSRSDAGRGDVFQHEEFNARGMGVAGNLRHAPNDAGADGAGTSR